MTWKIDHFTRDYVKKCGHSTNKDSEPFEMFIGQVSTVWTLRIYPNGDFRKQGVVGLFLVKKDESSQNYEYSCRFSIVNHNKEVVTSEFKSQPGSSDELNSGFGFLEFLSHEELFKRFHELVYNSQLIIRADIVLTPPRRETEIVLQSSV